MRLTWTRRGCLASALALPRLAQAQTDSMAGVFADWMGRHQVTAGRVGLALEGRLVVNRGFGGMDPGRPGPVWSLSKLVTGLAIARLVAQRRLTIDTTLAEAMPQRLARHRVSPGSPLGSLTMAQLLSQRSGLPRSPGGEDMPGLRAAIALRHPRDIGTEQLASSLLAVVPERPAGQSFTYSNTNFLLLGFAIEEVSGEPYARFVARDVLGRLGIRAAALDATWGSLGAGGGWSLSPAEYLAVLLRGVAGQAMIPPAIRAWMAPGPGTAIAPNSPVSYTLGQFTRPAQGGQNRWHAGAWRYRVPDRQIDESAGSFAVLAADGSAWFADFRPHPGDSAVGDLDNSLWRGRRAETGQGMPDLFPALVGPPVAG